VINPYLHPKVRRVAPESNLDGFIRATVVSQVLFLNLISFPENAARRAASESRAEVFFMKILKKKSQLHCFLSDPHCLVAFMFFLAVFHLLANNCTTEMYSILGADKLRRISSLQFINAFKFLQI